MSSPMKLTYFNVRGLAEPIRFLLKYGEIDFEDIRINKEDWPALKNDTPFGQLPVLEHNGKKYFQSIAIARYVGKLVGLSGQSDAENAEIDAIVDSIQDLRTKLATFYFEADETRKKTLSETFFKETLPNYFSRFDAFVEKNNGFLAVGRLTWADLFFASFTTSFNKFADNPFGPYPNLKALSDKVYEIPAIKKWVEERPETEL